MAWPLPEFLLGDGVAAGVSRTGDLFEMISSESSCEALFMEDFTLTSVSVFTDFCCSDTVISVLSSVFSAATLGDLGENILVL